MANASVEKLKALGLRHGEKAVMGLAAALSVMCLFLAATRPTIQMTPEEVSKAADQASSNLKRVQSNEDILKTLEENGIKNPNFEKKVDEQASNKLTSVAYKVSNPWATPEPGAGLIRDTPELIAPTELVAYPGRGGAVVYELKDGERIPLNPEDAAAEQANLTPGRRRRRSMRASYGGGSSSMGMPGMGGAPLRPDQIAKQKKEYEREVARKKKAMSGKDEPAAEEKKQPDAAAGPFKETTRGLRWVAITGVLDYKTLRENYLTALKRKEIAYPYFKGLGLQRQSLQSDGSWSEWEDVDSEKNAEILNNLPEEDEEWAPATVVLEHLVDPLPFLKAGYWERVHVARLVPKEKKEGAKPQLNFAGGGMMGGSESMQQMMMEQNQANMMGGAGSDSYGSSMSMGMGMMGMEGAGSGPADDMNFPKSEEDTLMVRALDFTVDPDTTYRYKVQIIVRNPNYKRGDVSPGTETEKLELKGPFSEPTEAVTVPPDVATYAMQKPAGGSDQVQFQVAKWDPGKGVMVVKTFDAGPGDIIGEYGLTDIPTSDGSGIKKDKVDFNSRQVVLDTMGGTKRVPAEIDNSQFEIPALSLVVRNDGTVVVRNQALDQADEVRKTTEENYKREKEESTKKRDSSSMYYGSSAGS